MSSLDRMMSPALNRIFPALFALSAVVASAGEKPVPGKTETPDHGTRLYTTVCTQCHGPKGEGNETLKAPSIGGMPAWYVSRQLINFRAGHRGTDPGDPTGMLMASMAKTLPADELEAVSAYVENLPSHSPKLTAALKDASAENGRFLFEERCMECHRFNGTGEVVFGSPPLVGRQDWYLLEQVRKFKSGRRGAVPGDVNGAKMVLSSQFIENDEAARDVIAYILTLNQPAEDVEIKVNSPVVEATPFDSVAPAK